MECMHIWIIMWSGTYLTVLQCAASQYGSEVGKLNPCHPCPGMLITAASVSSPSVKRKLPNLHTIVWHILVVWMRMLMLGAYLVPVAAGGISVASAAWPQFVERILAPGVGCLVLEGTLCCSLGY